MRLSTHFLQTEAYTILCLDLEMGDPIAVWDSKWNRISKKYHKNRLF